MTILRLIFLMQSYLKFLGIFWVNTTYLINELRSKLANIYEKFSSGNTLDVTGFFVVFLFISG